MDLKKILSFFIVIIIIFYLVVEIGVPVYVEKQITRRIKNNFDNPHDITVEVETFPPWELLFAMADKVKVKADTLTYQGIEMDNVVSHYKNILIDSGEIQGKNTDLNIVITEENLNRYLHQKYSALKNLEVHLQPENVFMKGEINVFGSPVKLKVNGSFKIKEGNRILFVPGEVEIEKLKISKNVLNQFIKDAGYAFNLEKIGFPVTVDYIKIQKNQLLLLSGNFAERAGVK